MAFTDAEKTFCGPVKIKMKMEMKMKIVGLLTHVASRVTWSLHETTGPGYIPLLALA